MPTGVITKFAPFDLAPLRSFSTLWSLYQETKPINIVAWYYFIIQEIVNFKLDF